MPYVLPLDTVPRSLRPAERGSNSSSAPLPGVPRRARTPNSNLAGNVRIGFTFVPPTPENENEPNTRRLPAAESGFNSPPPSIGMLALASPSTPLLHVSQSTPLPCLALNPRRRARREEGVPFPTSTDVLGDASNSSPHYVLAPVEPKHLPINSGKNGALRLSMDAIKAAITGQAQAQQAQTQDAPAARPTPSLRKKSGELVKPSLKHAHTLSGGLPTQKSLSLSRSAPATPTMPKFVHFDAQLEHVRLFLAEQKPTAVSRDGSPTETSEGEGNEFPWNGRGGLGGAGGGGIGYGSSDDERVRKALRVKHTNVPVNPSIEGCDVRVQSLVLSDDGSSLVGRVLVRNIAFEKWVAARFTFDWWQTTSEVSARYIDTVGDGVDRFGFTIKLGDVLHRIEEKTLFVAVRYTVSGREIWDSNHGQNYQVSFTKEREQQPATNAWSAAWSSKSRTRDQMSDLRKSLEKVMQEDEDCIPQLQIKARPRPSVRGMSFSGFENKKPTVASIVEDKPPKLGARYDFGAAPRQRPCADTFRMPELKHTVDPGPKRHGKRPSVSTEVARDISEAKLCSSPRDAEDGLLRLRMAPVEPLVRSGGLDLPSPAEPVAAASRRHHHRAAYFDAWTFPAPGVKRTVSGAPVDDWMDGTDLFVSRDVPVGGSVASTPSVTSASSPSQSPSSPPEFLPSPDMVDAVLDVPKPNTVDPSNYSSFLDRFCFFTGSDDTLAGYSEATARTLRAVSSTLSNNSSEGSTPRAGSPASLRSPSPLQVN
ncbi:unnamed protein product [Rhizoctonia solani]|uniref:CBM21 domain-containing protein n=1 Tax=Rhizoctonia solani TaxID=456999 RepID=A0A8H3H1N7_9AGAM|nr:unnamed protein product [Rhizoctonia solani]